LEKNGSNVKGTDKESDNYLHDCCEKDEIIVGHLPKYLKLVE